MNKTNYLNQTNYFSRQETLKITNVSNSQLGYFEKLGIIKPIYRDGRKIYYSWIQLLELKILGELRKKVSLQIIREAINNLVIYCNDSNLSNKKLVAYNNEIVLLDINEDLNDIIAIEMSGKNNGQFLLHQILPMNNIVNELLDNGKNNIVDFNERLKAEGIDYSWIKDVAV